MEEAASIGLRPEDYEQAPAEIEVWEENAQSVNVFLNLSTQWRVSAAGPVGIDYIAIEPVLRMMRVPRFRWPDVFDDIRVMESAAIAAISQKPPHG